MPGTTAKHGGNNVLEIEPSTLSGSLKLPPSKSHSMRWLTLASMDKSPTKIEMWEIGEDVQAMIDCLVQLGITWDGQFMTGGDFKPSSKTLDCKNSGTALRFLIAQAATCDFPATIDGDASLRARSSLHLVQSLGISAKITFEKFRVSYATNWAIHCEISQYRCFKNLTISFSTDAYGSANQGLLS